MLGMTCVQHGNAQRLCSSGVLLHQLLTSISGPRVSLPVTHSGIRRSLPTPPHCQLDLALSPRPHSGTAASSTGW